MKDKKRVVDKAQNTKKGFALLLTLSVLSVIIALTIVLLGYFDIVKKDATNTKALIQANIFYGNVLKAFGKSPPLKTLYKRSSRLSKGKFNMTIACKPLANGANINWLSPYPHNKKDKTYKKKRNIALQVYQMIATEYQIKEPQELFEQILLEIGGKDKFVQHKHNRLRQKNGITSYEQFEKIVTRYQLTVDDEKVGKVPWRKYFAFFREGELIDIEYASAELIGFLLEIDVQVIREWQINRKKVVDPDNRSLKQVAADELAQQLYTAREFAFAKKLLDEAKCKVSYNVGGQGYHFTFEYLNERGRHFEFFGRR